MFGKLKLVSFDYVSGLEQPLCGDKSNLTNNVTFISTSYFITQVFRSNEAGSNFKSQFNLTFLSFSEGMYIFNFLINTRSLDYLWTCYEYHMNGPGDKLIKQGCQYHSYAANMDLKILLTSMR